MNIKLNKPLVFIDIEATGLNISSDRIIEIALWKWMPDGTESGLTERVNPGIPISEQAFKVHGISESDIKDCPGFKMKAPKWIEFIGNADLAGFNSNKYDISAARRDLNY
ncbi:MAG: exonuclease domain-containing protein, partial [Bacteroidia bacterium]